MTEEQICRVCRQYGVEITDFRVNPLVFVFDKETLRSRYVCHLSSLHLLTEEKLVEAILSLVFC